MDPKHQAESLVAFMVQFPESGWEIKSVAGLFTVAEHPLYQAMLIWKDGTVQSLPQSPWTL